jgi:hypothetical protein
VAGPVGREPLPNPSFVAPGLDGIVGCKEHEEGLADLGTVADLLKQIFATDRDDHLVNAIARVRLDSHRFWKVLLDPLQQERQGVPRATSGELITSVEQLAANRSSEDGTLSEKAYGGVSIHVPGIG